MKVTDEMVEAAWSEYIQKSHATNSQAMRAALEAALGVKHSTSTTCIEELAGWLDKLAPQKREGFVDHPARAVLKRWGLK